VEQIEMQDTQSPFENEKESEYTQLWQEVAPKEAIRTNGLLQLMSLGLMK
jgi:hypothetical protein